MYDRHHRRIAALSRGLFHHSVLRLPHNQVAVYGVERATLNPLEHGMSEAISLPQFRMYKRCLKRYKSSRQDTRAQDAFRRSTHALVLTSARKSR